jgi:hypothetical protein
MAAAELFWRRFEGGRGVVEAERRGSEEGVRALFLFSLDSAPAPPVVVYLNVEPTSSCSVADPAVGGGPRMLMAMALESSGLFCLLHFVVVDGAGDFGAGSCVELAFELRCGLPNQVQRRFGGDLLLPPG